MADINKIKNRLRGLKAWYTKIETACEPYASGAKAGDKNIYETKQHELTTAKKKIDDALTELLFASNYQEDSAEEKEHLEKVNEMQTKFDTMMDRLSLKEAEACRSNLAKAESTKRYVKPIFELKPKEFNCNSTIDEVEPFIRQFTAFFNQSNLDLVGYEDQQQYLKNCLDMVLVQYLDTKIDPTTPVIGSANSCVNVLRGYFSSKYPLLTRRMEAFTLKQPSGVPFLDYYGKARQVYKAAEIEKLTAEQLTSYLLITSTTDAELRKEFLKLKDPDTKALLDCARTYVRANQKPNKSEQAEGTFAVTEGFSRSRPKRRSFKSQLRRLGITCCRCGNRGGHSEETCDKDKDQLKCLTCGATGHVAETCFDNLRRNNSYSRDLPQQRNRSGSRDRLQRRASTPGRNPSNPWGIHHVEENYIDPTDDFCDDVFHIDVNELA